MNTAMDRLVCSVEQASELIELGIFPRSILTTPQGQPVWTKAEIDVMIGPKYAKPDLWNDTRMPNSATDPNTYPVFTPAAVSVFTNGAQASAYGLAFILRARFIYPDEANERYTDVFFNDKTGNNGTFDAYNER